MLALVLLVLNFFNACSIKPIYNNLDRLIVWQVGDYLDLNRDQKASLRTDLSVLLKWHRESHLILYADWLAELPNQYSDGVSAQMIEDLFDQMLVWGEEIENQAMPLMTDVLVSLNEESNRSPRVGVSGNKRGMGGCRARRILGRLSKRLVRRD